MVIKAKFKLTVEGRTGRVKAAVRTGKCISSGPEKQKNKPVLETTCIKQSTAWTDNFSDTKPLL